MTVELHEPGRDAAAPASLFADPRRGIHGILIRLAWPVMAERVALTLLTAVDALLVGRYVGTEGVAAVGIGSLLLWLPLVAGMGAEVGATALVARDVGSGSARAVERSVEAAVLATLLSGLAAGLPLALAAPMLMRWMGAQGQVAPLGVEYLRPAAAGLPFFFVMMAANGALRGLGNTVRPMLVQLAISVVNLVVTFVLISGVLRIELGVRASGIGYGAAGAAGGLCALAMLVHGYGGVRYRLTLDALRPGWDALRRFFTLAVPVALSELQFIGAFLVYTRIIAGAGTGAVAAHTVAMRTLDVTIVPSFALDTAATTLVGQAMGMARPDLAEASAKAARLLALIIMVGAAALLLLLGPQVAGLFVDDPAIVDTSATLLRIFALALPGIAVSASTAGALRGAGDVRYVLGAMTVTTWFVRLPVAWVCAVALGWGAPGAWIGAVLDNTIRGALLTLRFATGRWKTIRF